MAASVDRQIVTCDARMRAVVEDVERVAQSTAPLLLIGETGTGKELLADHFHRSGPRPRGPFAKISLAALPTELIESELFGYERGAFTGAQSEKPGLFEIADGGTLFLDDIDDVPPAVQVKLLRVLELNRVHRLGGLAPFPVDVRIVTASKVDLRSLIDRKLFRADFYYRISCCPVVIPPLRDRPGDIPLLLRHFLKSFSPQSDIRVPADVDATLRAYHWPGNVRELRNVAHRMVVLGAPTAKAIRDGLSDNGGSATIGHAERCARCQVDQGLSYEEVVTCLERHLLQQALESASDNISGAARSLNISVSTLRDRMRRLGVSPLRQR